MGGTRTPTSTAPSAPITTESRVGHNVSFLGGPYNPTPITPVAPIAPKEVNKFSNPSVSGLGLSGMTFNTTHTPPAQIKAPVQQVPDQAINTSRVPAPSRMR